MRSWASRQPDLPRREARVLAAARASSSTSAPTRSAISPTADDRPPAPQSVIAVYRSLGVDEHVDQQLLGDRVADLHAGAGDLAGGGVHRRRWRTWRRGCRRARCARRARRPGRRGTGRSSGGAVGGDADAAAEHQRVGGVAGVVEHGAGDGRQADLVAVVGDAGDDARRGCAAGGATPSGSSSSGEVGRAEAQHVGDGDRPVGGAHHVADHAADAGVGAAERLDRRRVVVGLGLEGERRARRRTTTMPALPTNADAHERRGDRRRWRRAAGAAAARPACRRRCVIAARNVLWAQCSLHVWASVSSSTSVGSRPVGAEVVAGSRPARPGRAPAPAPRSSAAEPGVVEVAHRHRLGRRRPSDAAGREPGLDRRRSPSARSPGWRATRRSRTSTASAGIPAGSSMRRAPAAARDADAELAGGAHERAGGGVGDAGVQGDLVGAVVARRVVPGRRSAAAGRRGTPRAARGRCRRGRRRARRRRLTTTGPGRSIPWAEAAAAMASSRGSVAARMVRRAQPGTAPTLEAGAWRLGTAVQNVRPIR